METVLGWYITLVTGTQNTVDIDMVTNETGK